MISTGHPQSWGKKPRGLIRNRRKIFVVMRHCCLFVWYNQTYYGGGIDKMGPVHPQMGPLHCRIGFTTSHMKLFRMIILVITNLNKILAKVLGDMFWSISDYIIMKLWWYNDDEIFVWWWCSIEMMVMKYWYISSGQHDVDDDELWWGGRWRKGGQWQCMTMYMKDNIGVNYESAFMK